MKQWAYEAFWPGDSGAGRGGRCLHIERGHDSTTERHSSTLICVERERDEERWRITRQYE